MKSHFWLLQDHPTVQNQSQIHNSPTPTPTNPPVHQNPDHFNHLILSRSPQIQQFFISEFIRLNNRQQYYINPDILVGTSISQLMRAKLRDWIMIETSRRNISRKITVTANTLVDLFLARGGKVKAEKFQIFGLSLLILANKLEDKEIIDVDPNVFSRKQINYFQLNLCMTLKFSINPITYVHLLDEFINFWNCFSMKHDDLWLFKSSRGFQKTQNKIQVSSQKIYEMLDCLYLILKTYSYSIFDVTLQVFRIFLNIQYNQISKLPKPIEDEVIISFWCNPEEHNLMNEPFQAIFNYFIKQIQQNCPQISYKPIPSIEYLVSSLFFAGFQVSIEAQNYSSQIQTYNAKSYELIKAILKPKKNRRKSSSETTF